MCRLSQHLKKLDWIGLVVGYIHVLTSYVMVRVRVIDSLSMSTNVYLFAFWLLECGKSI